MPPDCAIVLSAFGGANLKNLYTVSRKSLLSTRVNMAGHPAYPPLRLPGKARPGLASRAPAVRQGEAPAVRQGEAPAVSGGVECRLPVRMRAALFA
jgi:hypothetical protein